MISKPAFLATAAATLLMLASCSSDEIDTTTPNNGRGIPLRFTVSLGSDAPGHGPQRAMGSDSVKGKDYDQLYTFWAEGDKVSLVLYHKGKPTVSVATLGELDDTKRLGTFTTVLDPWLGRWRRQSAIRRHASPPRQSLEECHSRKDERMNE